MSGEIIRSEKEQALLDNQRMGLAIGVVDNVNFSAIFALFLEKYLRRFLDELGQYYLFSFVAIFSILEAGLAWQKRMLTDENSRSKDFLTASAILKTISAVGVSVAVAGTLFASAIFAAISPIMFTAITIGKTVFHTGAAIYFNRKSMLSEDPVEKEEYYQLAKDNTISAGVGVFASIAIMGVFALGHVAVTAFGIITGVVGAIYSAYRLFKTFVAPQKEEPTLKEDEKPLLENTHDNDNDLNCKNPLVLKQNPTPTQSCNILKVLSDSSAARTIDVPLSSSPSPSPHILNSVTQPIEVANPSPSLSKFKNSLNKSDINETKNEEYSTSPQQKRSPLPSAPISKINLFTAPNSKENFYDGYKTEDLIDCYGYFDNTPPCPSTFTYTKK